MEYQHDYPYPHVTDGNGYTPGINGRTEHPDILTTNMRNSALHDSRAGSPQRRAVTPQRVDFVVGNATGVRVEPLVTYSTEYPPLQRSASVSSSRRDAYHHHHHLQEQQQQQSRRTSSLRSKSQSEPPEEPLVATEPVDGCLVLGRQGPSFASYVTRYRVNRDQQREGVAREEVIDTCLPCCVNSSKQTPVKFIMTCLTSEAFLFSTHLLVLMLGVMRALLVDRATQGALHNVLSSSELLLTTANLLARFGLVRTMFGALHTHITKLEHVEEGLSARGADLRNWMWTYTGLTAIAVVVNLTAFIILHAVHQHNWTLFSNTLLLLCFTAGSRIFTQRVSSLSHQVQRDQVRVVLYESTLLLREGFLVTRASQRRGYRERVDSFLNAFRATKVFKKPSHIHLLREHVPDWERTSMGTEPVTSC